MTCPQCGDVMTVETGVVSELRCRALAPEGTSGVRVARPATFWSCWRCEHCEEAPRA